PSRTSACSAPTASASADWPSAIHRDGTSFMARAYASRRAVGIEFFYIRREGREALDEERSSCRRRADLAQVSPAKEGREKTRAGIGASARYCQPALPRSVR